MWRIAKNAAVAHIEVDRDGGKFVATSEQAVYRVSDSTVTKIWSPENGALVVGLHIFGDHLLVVLSSREIIWFVTSGQDAVRSGRQTLDCPSGMVLTATALRENVLAVAFHKSESGPSKKKTRQQQQPPVDRGDENGDVLDEDDDDDVCVVLFDVSSSDGRLQERCEWTELCSEEVHSLAFSSDGTRLLVGSADGLVCTLLVCDVSAMPTDFEDTIGSTNNVESSVSKVGWLDSTFFYATTDDNRVAFFRENSFGDVDLLKIRAPPQQRFVVDCITAIEARGSVGHIVETSAVGAARLVAVNSEFVETGQRTNNKLHSDMISVCLYRKEESAIYLGGDDGLLSRVVIQDFADEISDNVPKAKTAVRSPADEKRLAIRPTHPRSMDRKRKRV